MRSDITLSFWINSAGHYLYSKLCLPDILCIIHCLQSESAIMCKRPEELPDFWPLNIPGLNTFCYKIWASNLPEKKQDVNDLTRHLIDARVGVKYRVINDGIYQWRRCLHAYIRATRRHSEYSS